MSHTPTNSIAPGLLKRSLLRFERTAFHALAELLEDLGAFAYHRYAVLDARCTWRDTRFEDSYAPQRDCGASPFHTSESSSRGETPLHPGESSPPQAPAPGHPGCPNVDDPLPESHVVCRTDGDGTSHCNKAHRGQPLFSGFHQEAHVGRPLFGVCPHSKARIGRPLFGACLHFCHRG